jgi:hypothetical protein
LGQVLNFFWVLLSVSALVGWVCRYWRRSSAYRGGLAGLICALVLLFPVISPNDDLLLQQFLVTPVSPVLKAFLDGRVFSDNRTPPSPSAPVVLPLRRATEEVIGDESPLPPCAVPVGATGDRSPPRIS